MRTFRTLIWLTILFGLCFARPAYAAEKVVLQLRWDHQFQFAGFYAALWQGYYDEAGLDVEIRSAVTPDRKILSATAEVAEGRADFGLGAGDILLAVDQGAPLVVVAAIFQHSPVAVFSRPELNIDGPGHLSNLTVQSYAPGLADVEYYAMLDAEGIDPERAPLEYTGNLDDVSTKLLLEGEIDAFLGWIFPALWPANQSQGAVSVLRPASYGIDFYGDTLFAGRSLVERNPDLVERFEAASLKGWEYALANPIEIADRITRELPRRLAIEPLRDFNRYLIDPVGDVVSHPEVELGHVNPARWALMHAAMRDAGLVDGDLDLETLVFDPERREREAVERYLSLALAGIALVLLVLAGAIAWTFALRRTVAARTAALWESETLLKHAQRQAKIGHWRWSAAEEKLTYLSDQAALIAGDTDDIEVADNETMYANVHPEDRDRIVAAVNAADEKQQGFDIEFRIVGRDGAIRYVREIGEAQFNARGRFIGQFGTIQDITELRRAEVARRRTEALLQAIVENAPHGLALKDSDGRFAFANRVFARIHRIAEGDLPGKTAYDLWPREMAEHFTADDRTIIERGGVRETEAALNGPDGDRVLHVTKFRVDEYETDRSYVGLIVTDITAQKQAEEALRISEVRFRGIIENAPLSILLKDADGRILIANGEFLERYGYTEEEVVGKTDRDLQSAELADIYTAQDREVLASRRTVREELNTRFADGTDREVTVTKFPILDRDGRAVGVGSISHDATAQKQIEKQLRRAQKMEAIGQVAGGVAHEFNNLLMVVQGNAELLEDELTDSGRPSKFVIAIKRAAERGAHLTRQLLSYSRQQELHPQSIDANRVIHELETLLRPLLGESIEVEIRAGDTQSATRVDPGQLQDALLNLAINARDAMPDGGRLTIRTANVSLDRDKAEDDSESTPVDYVMISLTDTGCGMAPTVLERAIDPFFTTKDVGEGTGLGLSMVQGFAEQSGGILRLESVVGEGTTVRLYLPRAERVETAAAETDDAEAPGGAATVLVVEDDEAVLDLVSTSLNGLGYTVLTARAGDEALTKLGADGAIDLLLTDMVMPGGMNGLNLAHRAREIVPGLKVVLTTGYSEEIIESEDRVALCAGILKKPYRKRELAEVVRRALEGDVAAS